MKKRAAAWVAGAALLCTLGAACAKPPSSGSRAAESSASRTYWVSAPLIVWRGEPGPRERKFSGSCRVTPLQGGKPGAWLNAAPGSSGTDAWWDSGAAQRISVLTGELRYLGDCLESAGFPIDRQAPPVVDARYPASGETGSAAFSLHVELEATEEFAGGSSLPYRAAQIDFTPEHFPAFDDAKNPGRMNTVEVECSSPSGNGSLIMVLRLWQTTTSNP